MLSFWKFPHGFSAQYYANPVWSDKPYVKLERYFETSDKTNDQRIDRFLDFNPNDFNDHDLFSGKTASA